MILVSEDAPQWLKNEPLRKKWVEINNARLRVWRPDEAPAWISTRWKREEWAQEKNGIEVSNLTHLVPCICDKCGAEFIGTEWGKYIVANDYERRVLGTHREAIHFETDCVLCASCFDRLRLALQEFETRWVHESDSKPRTPL